MEALGGCGCSLKALPESFGRERPAPSPSPSLTQNLIVRAFGSFVPPKIQVVGSVSLVPGRIRVGPLRSSSLLPPSFPHLDPANLKEVGSGTPEATEMTVCIRFVLRKKCLFGQQFFLVGEDPLFGSWDPSSAIPMDWSEGHIWTVEQNIPVGSKTLFKFILKLRSGEIEWQPGPDRVLKLWITKGTIIIEEDWESPELQKAIEEVPEDALIQMLPEEEAKTSCSSECCAAMKDDYIDNTEVSVLVQGLPIDEVQGAMIDNFMENAEGPVLVPGLSSKSTHSAAEPLEQGERRTGAGITASLGGQLFSSESIDEADHGNPAANQSRGMHMAQSSNGNQVEEITMMSCQGSGQNLPSSGTVDLTLAAAVLKNDIQWALRNLFKLFWGVGFHQRHL